MVINCTLVMHRIIYLTICLIAYFPNANSLTVPEYEAFLSDALHHPVEIEKDCQYLLDNPAALIMYETYINKKEYDEKSPLLHEIINKNIRIQQILLTLALKHAVIYTLPEIKSIWNDSELKLGSKHSIGLLLYAETGDWAIASEAMAGSPLDFTLFMTYPDKQADKIFKAYCAKCYSELINNSDSKPASAALSLGYKAALDALRFQKLSEDIWSNYIKIFPLFYPTLSSDGNECMVGILDNDLSAFLAQDPRHFSDLIWTLFQSGKVLMIKNAISHKIITDEFVKKIIDDKCKYYLANFK